MTTQQPDDPSGPRSPEAIRNAVRTARDRARELAARALLAHAAAAASGVTADRLVAAANEVCDGLRRTVAEHARLMRELDEPPERVVTVIKEIAAGALRDVETVAPLRDHARGRMLRESLVQWTIEAYYGALSGP